MKYNYLNLTQKHFVLVAILVFALELPLSLWEIRTESTPDSGVYVTYTGLPFETIKITKNVTSEPGLAWHREHERSAYRSSGQYPYHQDPHHQSPFSTTESREYLWNGIISNTMLLTAFSIILVKLSTRIYDEIEYRKHKRVH